MLKIVVLSRAFHGLIDASMFKDCINKLLWYCGKWPDVMMFCHEAILMLLPLAPEGEF